MPATIKHVFSNAIADGTNTNIVRPVDWNSVHALTLNISGTDISQAFSNENGVSFGTNPSGYVTGSHNGLTTAAQSNHSHGAVSLSLAGGLSGTYNSNSDGLTLSLTQAAAAAQPLNFSAGTTSNNLSAVTFDNSNGVSFGLNGSVITGSVATNYAASNHSHGNPTLALTNLSGTTASDSAGLTLSLSAAAPGGVAIAGGTQTATSGTVVFANSNGVTFGMSNSSRITANIAAASNIVIGGNTIGVNTSLSAGGNQFGVSAVRNITLSADAPYLHLYAEFQPTLSNLGNTAGNTGTYRGPLVLAGSNNITLSQSTGTFTTGAAGITGTRATITINGPDLSPYLTTAMASNRGSDFVQATAAFAGTNASGTIASNGISVSVGNYITTAMLSNAVTLSNIRVSAGTTSNLLSALTLANSNGVSFGLNAGTITATVKTDYLTTARASNDAVGLNTALTAGPLAWTVNSAGISLNAGSAAGTTSGFGGNLISGSMTHNSAGLNLSLNHPAWLTTAMQSNAATISNIRVSGGTTSNLLSALTFADSNGVSFGLNAGTLTATVKTDYQSQGAYLTTAMQSNAATISNIRVSAGTTSNLLSALTFDNANGITFGLNASTLTASHNGLTTAALSNHSHGNPQLNLTNLSGTTASNSAGFTLSLSANGAAAGVGIEMGTRTATTAGNIRFETGNGITFGLDGVGGSVVTASHNGLTTAMASNRGSDFVQATAAFAGTNASGTIASNGISVSVAAPGAAVSQFYANPPWGNAVNSLITNVTAVNNRPFFVPFNVFGTLTAQELMWLMSRSTSGSNAFTLNMGVYGYSNSSVITLITSAQNVYSHTATASVSGIKMVEANIGSFSLTPGNYLLGMLFSANGGNTASMNYSIMGQATANPNNVNVMITGTDSFHTYTSHQPIPLEGRYSTTSGALPGTVSQGGVIGGFTGASLPIRMNFTLGTHN